MMTIFSIYIFYLWVYPHPTVFNIHVTSIATLYYYDEITNPLLSIYLHQTVFDIRISTLRATLYYYDSKCPTFNISTSLYVNIPITSIDTLYYYDDNHKSPIFNIPTSNCIRYTYHFDSYTLLLWWYLLLLVYPHPSMFNIHDTFIATLYYYDDESNCPTFNISIYRQYIRLRSVCMRLS